MKKLKRLLVMVFFLAISSLGFSTEFKIHGGSSGEANLREKPNTNSRILAKLEIFESGKIIKKEGNWYYIEYETEAGKKVYGYIHKSQGILVDSYIVSTKDGYANIREEASSKSRIMGRAYNGEMVSSYGEEDGWLHITWDGSAEIPVAYIHKSQVKKIKY